MCISVLLIDDHAMVRAGLALALDAVIEGEHQIGEASSVAEGLQWIAQVGPPDLVLLDIQMPEMSGIEGFGLVRRAAPLARIAIVSGSQNAAMGKALALGADGFLLKTLTLPLLKEALSDLLQGKRFFMGEPARPEASGPDVEASALASLSPRFRDVAGLVARGYTNKVIARELGLSENTVRFYVSRTLTQLGLQSRTELSYWMHQRGMV